MAHPVTLRTQELMTTPNNKYERPDDVVVEEEDAKTIISSYTVEPSLLFVTSEKGKYDIYVDTTGDRVETPNEFMIHLGLDSESENDFEDNGDYVGLGPSSEQTSSKGKGQKRGSVGEDSTNQRKTAGEEFANQRETAGEDSTNQGENVDHGPNDQQEVSLRKYVEQPTAAL